MDTSDAANNNLNNEEKTQEIQVLLPNLQQYSLQNDLNKLQLPSRDRSFIIKPEGTLSRRPSAIVSAIQHEHRPSAPGRIFFE